MNKKFYQIPTMTIVLLRQQTHLLADSYDITSLDSSDDILISDDEDKDGIIR